MAFNLPSYVQTRPIIRWPGPLTSDWSRRSAPFRSSWRSTMDLLDHELRALTARSVVLQVAMEESDFRIDGLPRANARAKHPGVILSFDTARGRLEFATDVFRTWEENLRAIALGLAALRKVDRYGITRGDAQYSGFKALPRGDDGSMGLYTAADAQEWLNERFGGDIRAALRATHPDSNPDAEPDDYRRVIRVKELTGA